jgi:hypothetical protein
MFSILSTSSLTVMSFSEWSLQEDDSFSSMDAGGGIAPSPPLPELEAFRKLVAGASKRPLFATQQKFVKKLDCIPIVELPIEETCRSTVNLADRGLIGQFTGLWPSPKSVEAWVQRNWTPLISEGIKSHFVGKGFFVFVFESSEDKNLIFRNDPYFMGPQGLYLNKWTPDFDPAQDVSSAVPVWVRLPHLPLHCWNKKSLHAIDNTLGRYIDQAVRKDQYSCAQICVEVDLEVGLPEAIKLTAADWTHIQELDYEQLPFKCRHCHGYGHFARHCKKKNVEESENAKAEQWITVQKAGTTKPRSKGITKESNPGQSGQEQKDGTSNPMSKSGSQNAEPSKAIEEPEANMDSNEQSKPSPNGKGTEEQGKTAGTLEVAPSPSYADIARKKVLESPSSSEDEILERPAKRAGRKSRREAREEEAERQKTQGSQPTIEMSIGRNTRTRPPKGGGPTIPNNK